MLEQIYLRHAFHHIGVTHNVFGKVFAFEQIEFENRVGLNLLTTLYRRRQTYVFQIT